MWEKVGVKIACGVFRTLWGKLKSVLGGKRVKITAREVEIPVPGGRSIKYSERITEVPLSKETISLVDGGVESILTSPATADAISKVLGQAGAKELEKPKVREKRIKQREDVERLVEAPQVKALPDKEKLLFTLFAFVAYGDKSFHSDAFCEAENAYREAYEFAKKLDDKPLQGICLNLIGTAIGNQRRDEEALPLFEEALTLKSDLAEAWYNKGVSLLRLKRYEKATVCFDKVIRLKPNDADAWHGKGAALFELERYEEAIACFGEAIRLEPDLAEAWYNKGTALAGLERYEEAISCFDEAIRLDPDFAMAWCNKGVALSRLEQCKDAIPCLDEAIKLDPDDAEAWYNKGTALIGLEREEEAIPCFDEATRLNPDLGSAWAMKGLALFQLDQDKEAKQSFEKALPLRDQLPDNGMSVFNALTFLILMEGLESVASNDIEEAKERASELAQLRKEAEKDNMAQVVHQARAEFKGMLSKGQLKGFRKLEKILREVEEP